MILIADSGSTKTDWVLIDSLQNRQEFQTIGLNPLFLSEKYISDIQQIFDSLFDRSAIEAIHFFGSGCGTDSRKEEVRKHLVELCPNAQIIVKSDLEGAAVALFNDRPGIACILGTGSNSGVFNGNTITHSQVSLGYILGDEGSASHIVKAFIQALFYGKLSKETEKEFLDSSGLTIDSVIQNIYREPFPNRFLAQQLSYILPLKNNSEVKSIIQSSLKSFFDNHINYSELSNHEIGFVGSLAWYLKEELTEIAHERGLNICNIIRYPISEISSFYSNLLFSNEVSRN